MGFFRPFLLLALSVLSSSTPIIELDGHGNQQYRMTLESASRGFEGHYGYQCFDSTAKSAPYPEPNEWLPFGTLWNINQPAISSRNGGDTYIQHYLREAIEQSSQKHKIDPRLVLSAVLQVSGGKVDLPCLGPSRVKCDRVFDASRPQASISRMIDEGLQIVAKADCWIAFADRFAPHTYCGDRKYLSDVANRLLGWDGQGSGLKHCHEDAT